jgi:carboxyl-terminal processing protease
MRPGIAILLSACILALLMAFLSASRRAGANQATSGSAYWDEDIELFIRHKVARTYVDQLDAKRAHDAFNRAMDAYVRFDGYCDFIPQEEYKQWREDTAGRYAGLGVKINQVDEGLHIVGVFPGGPAAQAGIRVGDTMVRAAGHDLAGMAVDDITTLLKGMPGSRVKVGIVRGPRPEKGPAQGPVEEIVVTRDVIVPPTVFDRRVGPDGAFLQVRLTDFTEQTIRRFDEIMDAVATGKHPTSGILLDLRHNGGGVLSVAVSVAQRFLRAGRLIVRMEGRGPDASKDYPSPPSPHKLLDVPLVVLVDEWSASASEIVAGALQDHRRAVLVGVRTYGKFLVQSITEIPHKDAAVKLTTSRYYTPLGRSYQGSAAAQDVGRPSGRRAGSGLIPDVVVDLSDADHDRLVEYWANEEGRPWGETVRYPKVGKDYVDPQLAHALKLLEGEVVLQKINRSRGGTRRNG